MKKLLFLTGLAILLSAVSVQAGSFIDNGDSTVTDSSTGLMWQQTESVEWNWVQALKYCEDLALAGYSDWRLPNYKELSSLIDDARYSPDIDTASFPDAFAAY